MSRTRTWTRNLLLGTTIAVTSLALSACCKDNKEESSTEATPESETTESAETPEKPAELNTEDPEWKTKCPDAERPESGTVTALRNLQIYKEPKVTSDKLSSIGPGTWVNLLGAKGTWYCIDYPCDVGKLCPGWIESRYSKRKEPVKVEEEKKDAGKAEEEKKDAGKAEEEKKDAGKKTGGFKIPRLRFKDGGTAPKKKDSRDPVGGRPPSPDGIRPPK